MSADTLAARQAKMQSLLDTHSAPRGGEVENQTLGSRLSTAATWDLSPNNAAPAPAGAATALADEGLTGGWREIVHLH